VPVTKKASASTKARAKSNRTANFDSFINTVAGVGGDYDRRSYNGWEPNPQRSYLRNENDFIFNGIVENFVCRPIEDMLRMGIKWTKAKHEQAEEINDYLDDIDFWGKVETALTYERLFGGAAIWIDNGDSNHALPLDPAKVNKIVDLHVFDKEGLVADQYQVYREPEYYLVQCAGQDYGKRIHKSRLLIFPGRLITAERRQNNQGWGESEVERIADALEAFEVTFGTIPNIAMTYEQAVYKFKDLSKKLTTPEGQKNIKTKARMLELVRSYLNASLIDSEDEFQRQGVPVAGLDVVWVWVAKWLVAKSGMPHSLLLGDSVAGLGSTGNGQQHDINWMNRVGAMQKRHLRKPLNQFFKILLLSGKKLIGFAPESVKYEFNPLKQLSEKEWAEVQKLRAERDAIYLTNSVVATEEIREDLQRDETYDLDDTSPLPNDLTESDDAQAA
jgi:uncharacterized protein